MSHGHAVSPSVAADRPPTTGALVLDEDAGLFEAVAPARAERARNASMAAVMRLRSGSWDAGRDAGAARGGFGLLVLDRALIPLSRLAERGVLRREGRSWVVSGAPPGA